MIEKWLYEFVQRIKEAFPERIVFIGIQGSYARQEATENSDIDVVVIFDALNYKDIKFYDKIISGFEMREKICGFISGKKELENWDRADLFQFYHDTIALYGNLDFIKNLITFEDVVHAVKLGACNIYHMSVHNAVHEKSREILKALLKTAFFVAQANYYLEHKEYIGKRKILIQKANPDDSEILSLQYTDDFDKVSEALIEWSSALISKNKCSI